MYKVFRVTTICTIHYMRQHIWEVDTRDCLKKKLIILDMMTRCDNSHVYDLSYDTFCRAYSVSSDWPMPHTRVDTYVQHIDQYTHDASFLHSLDMRQYVQSRGFNGTLLTRPNSTHVVCTLMRMAGVAYREKITRIMLECIQIYNEKIPLMVGKCPRTWLFVESAHGLITQCVDGRYPNSGELVDLASLLPSKNEWCTLRDEMKFKIGSIEANTHLWRWFRLQHLFSDYIDYTKVWTSGGDTNKNSVLKRATSV
jgi:hypothetical protein